MTRTEILNLAINNLEQLKKLEIMGGKVSNISMTNLNRLREIDMQKIKRLPKLTLSNLMQLQKINIDEAKKLKSLTLENLTNLKLVSCTCGILSELNILGKNKISEMNLCCNELSKFRYDNLLDLVKLNINKNKIEGKFDFTLYPSLYNLDCQNNKLTEIYGGVANREINYIDCYNNQIKLIDFRGTTNGCILWMNCKKNPNIVVYAVVEDFEHDVTAKLYENI